MERRAWWFDDERRKRESYLSLVIRYSLREMPQVKRLVRSTRSDLLLQYSLHVPRLNEWEDDEPRLHRITKTYFLRVHDKQNVGRARRTCEVQQWSSRAGCDNVDCTFAPWWSTSTQPQNLVFCQLLTSPTIRTAAKPPSTNHRP